MPSNERTYWERHAKNYDRSMRIIGGPMPRALELTSRAVTGCEAVLEVAAGTGLITVAIAPKVQQLTATDYAEAMVEALRGRVDAAGFGNVTCERADLYALRYAPASFDAVVAANVLHLVPDLPRALAALRSVLRPGGKLIVPTFCHDETLVARVASRVIGLTGFPGHRRFTTASLCSAVVEAGFAVDIIETIPGVFPIAFVSARADRSA